VTAVNRIVRTHEYRGEVTAEVMGEINAQISPLIEAGVKVQLETEQLTFFHAATQRYCMRVSFRPGAFTHANVFEGWLRDRGWYE
jgi:hypothetical protein